MLSKEGLILKIRRSGIRPIDVVKYSEGMITSNQASQWLLFNKRKRNLSKAVFMMLWMMADKKEADNEIEDGPLNEFENAFEFKGKMNVPTGSYLRKSDKVYANFEGVVYEGSGDALQFKKDGKQILLEIGSEVMGKWISKS